MVVDHLGADASCAASIVDRPPGARRAEALSALGRDPGLRRRHRRAALGLGHDAAGPQRPPPGRRDLHARHAEHVDHGHAATSSSAWSICRWAMRRPTIGAAPRRPPENDYSPPRWSRSTSPPASRAGTSRPCTRTSGTMTSARRRRWSISHGDGHGPGAGAAHQAGRHLCARPPHRPAADPGRASVKAPRRRRRAGRARADPAVLAVPHAAQARPDRARHVGHVADRPDGLPHPVPPGAATRASTRRRQPTATRSNIPAITAASDWGGIAVDPRRGVIVANYNDMPNYNRLVPRAEADKRGWAPRDRGARQDRRRRRRGRSAGGHALCHQRQCRLAAAVHRPAVQAAALWRHPRHRHRDRQDDLGPPARHGADATARSASPRCCRSTSARPTMAARW